MHRPNDILKHVKPTLTPHYFRHNYVTIIHLSDMLEVYNAKEYYFVNSNDELRESSMKHLFFLLVLFLSMTAFGICDAEQSDRMHTHQYVTEEYGTINYWLYEPEMADAEMPLIVYLHGGSGKGSDPDNVLSAESLPAFIWRGQIADISAYVLCPQCPDTVNDWKTIIPEVHSLIDLIVTQYPIDSKRISLTGHSMGGTGTWDVGFALADYFCCIVPMSGRVRLNQSNTSILAGIPIWAFASEKDKVVNADYTRAAMEKLTRLHPSDQCTLFPYGSHGDVPSMAWLDPEINLIDWILQQKKN